MSGTALFITSPSARTTKRSTPWVDGCCGPMLRVMSSVTTPPPLSARWISTSNPASPIAGLRLQQTFARRRDAVVLLRLDEVLAQRVARPVLRHEQPAEIGAYQKAHAEENEDLALLTDGVAPHVRHGRHHRVVAERIHLEDDPVPMAVREEMVDQLDVPGLRIVDAGEIREAVEGERLVVAGEARHLGDALGRDEERRIPARSEEHTSELQSQSNLVC